MWVSSLVFKSLEKRETSTHVSLPEGATMGPCQLNISRFARDGKESGAHLHRVLGLFWLAFFPSQCNGQLDPMK